MQIISTIIFQVLIIIYYYFPTIYNKIIIKVHIIKIKQKIQLKWTKKCDNIIKVTKKIKFIYKHYLFKFKLLAIQ